jgi:molybdopterin/thiamine biosynthesis adenylyltransferase
MPGVARVVLIDHDTYDADNLASQLIFACDVGKPKAQVQGHRVWQVNAATVERAIQRPVETLPLSWLRSSVILAAVDSRRARMLINQAAWRLGVPWIDAGVDGEGRLIRVHVFVPGPDAACLECGWDDRDYALVDQAYPCQPAIPVAAGAASSVGALAAAFSAIECEKLLAGDFARLLAGRQLLVDATHHRHFVTRFARRPDCRMPDHGGWVIEPMTLDPAAATMEELASLVGARTGTDAHSTTIGVAGQQWALAARCMACGATRAVAAVVRAGDRFEAGRCRGCGGALRTVGFDLADRAGLADLAAAARGRSLSALGLLPGDVLVVESGVGTAYLEIVVPGAAVIGQETLAAWQAV